MVDYLIIPECVVLICFVLSFIGSILTDMFYRGRREITPFPVQYLFKISFVGTIVSLVLFILTVISYIFYSMRHPA